MSVCAPCIMPWSSASRTRMDLAGPWSPGISFTGQEVWDSGGDDGRRLWPLKVSRPSPPIHGSGVFFWKRLEKVPMTISSQGGRL
jgi:hypothetical protein